MDEAIAFLQEFAKRDYEMRFSRAGDPDPVFAEKLAAVESMLEGNFSLNLNRNTGLSPEELARTAANERPDLALRHILVVQHYQSQGWGDLYKAILSNAFTYSPVAYYNLFIVQRKAAGLKIIGYATVCRDCKGTGEIKGKRCPICFGTKWIRPNGVQIGDYGKLVETRKLEPPVDPGQRADYDAL